MDGEGDGESEGERDTEGDGGGSIDVWFVIPLQTVVASRDVIPGSFVSCCVSVSLPSS